jgi:DNA modification methylase
MKYNLWDNDSLPIDYHCNCEYCREFKGVILNPQDGFFNCRKRVGYHPLGERSHIAKTPYPIAMFAVDKFSNPEDWVMDPTIGIGTTAVEAKKQKRHIQGIELNPAWAKIVALNCEHYKESMHAIFADDVRNWKKLSLNKVQLIINNPPYSGDENVSIQTDEDGYVIDRTYHDYSDDRRNLAYLDEGELYYKTLSYIYNGLGKHILLAGGHLVIGVKDMIHNKKSYLLHKHIADIISESIYEYHGMYLLPHWPRTLFMNTYPKRFPEVKIPLYQTILVWRKK